MQSQVVYSQDGMWIGLRHEPVWILIDRMKASPELEVFDKVLVIEQAFQERHNKKLKAEYDKMKRKK